MEKEAKLIELEGVSYTRISTLGQVTDERGIRKDDASPEAHKARCSQHMAFKSQTANSKFKIVEHIVDEGFSGKNTNRPGFQRLFQLIAERRIKFVVTPELSRISRSVMDFLDFMSHCERNEVSVIVIGQEIDTTTPVGKMVVTILMAVAQAEREITAHRVRENVIARLIKDGKINGSAPILGLVRDPNRKGHFVSDPIGVQILRRVLSTYLEEPSVNAACKKLKLKGITNPDGSTITHSQISTIVANTGLRYKGLWEANRGSKDKDQTALSDFQRYQIVNLDHGPIVETSLLDAVSEKLKSVKATRFRSGLDSYVYLLSGVLVFQDGSKFAGEGSNSHDNRYYYNRTNMIRIRCDEIDPFIVSLVKEQFLNHERFEEMVANSAKIRQTQVPALKAELQNLQRELARLNQYEDGLRGQLRESIANPKPEFTKWLSEEVASMKARQSAIQVEMDRVTKGMAELDRKTGLENIQVQVKKVLNGFDTLTPMQKRSIVERIIKRIAVLEKNRLEIEFFTDGQTYRLPVRSSPVTVEDDRSVREGTGGESEIRTHRS